MKLLLKNAILTIALLLATMSFAKTHHNVLLIVLPGCEYCSEAENLLDKNGIKYRTSRGNGEVPRLYVDGKYKGTGLDAVQSWVRSQRSR